MSDEEQEIIAEASRRAGEASLKKTMDRSPQPDVPIAIARLRVVLAMCDKAPIMKGLVEAAIKSLEGHG